MNVFKNRSIKAVLREYIAQLPKNGRGEISRIASSLSVSTTLISQILAGARNFTPEQTQSLILYLGLVGSEADYINFLNQYERAGSAQLKEFWMTKLEEIRSRSAQLSNRLKTSRSLNDTEIAVFYSSPLYSVIRLFCSTDNKGKTLAEICERFEISKNKGALVLKFLSETHLCAEENGKYKMGTQSTHLEQGSPHLPKHLSNWRVRAMRRSEDLEESELMYSAPVSLSKKDFESLREEMVAFIKSFLAKVHASPAEEVACLNLDFFWIKK